MDNDKAESGSQRVPNFVQMLRSYEFTPQEAEEIKQALAQRIRLPRKTLEDQLRDANKLLEEKNNIIALQRQKLLELQNTIRRMEASDRYAKIPRPFVFL